MNDGDNPKQRWTWPHPLLTLVGTILIGAIGSGLWEIGIKPSLIWSGQLALDIITFGSTAAKDNAYKAAALDQTSIPAARLYAMTIGLFSAPLVVFLMYEFGMSPNRIRRIALSNSTTEEHHTFDERLSRIEEITEQLKGYRKRLAIVRRSLLVILGVLIGFVFVRHMIHNQSLLIWRSFNADLKQCAPYLTPDEEELIEAQFAAIQTKKDYSKILGEFAKIADKNHIVLHSTSLW